jgi:hypothetical protein
MKANEVRSGNGTTVQVFWQTHPEAVLWDLGAMRK